MNNNRLHWNAKAHRLLNNAKIIKVEYMSKDETEEIGWDSSPVALLVQKGKKQFWIFPMRDDEGNDGGALGMSNSESVLPVL